MREIMNFRFVWLLVQVFEQHQRAVPLGMTYDPLQPFKTGGHPPLFIGSEVEARMHDNPFGA